tara:strand:+ start:574 stop:1938 length:1365 start_codon:yes stop_codon:yes gene_type:complete
MEITQSKPKNLVVTITIKLKEADYIQKVENVLKDYRKTVAIPGFRKGKTPISIINKRYRRPVLIDEVSKIIQDKLYKYITENKIKTLGSPLPIKDESINWEGDKDFTFKYEVGLSPDFDVKITTKDKLEYFNIKVESALVNNYCSDIAKRHGKMSDSQVSIEGDLIFCKIEQLDKEGSVMENGISNDATVSMDYISEKKIKKKFVGVQVEDVIKINVMKAFSNSSDLSAMLNITNKDLEKLESEEFQFTVKKINQLQPAKLDQELFDKVYGKGIVENLKEFKSRIKQEAESQFSVESDRMFKNDVVYYLINKLKLSMPDDFLKRWLLQTSEQPITEDILEKEYDMYAKGLQWQLIENKILQEYKINVSKDDVLDHAKQLISMQMKQYGQQETDDEQLTSIANNILNNEEEKKKIYDQIFDKRTLEVYKNNFKLVEKKISYDDFIKLASEKNNNN